MLDSITGAKKVLVVVQERHPFMLAMLACGSVQHVVTNPSPSLDEHPHYNAAALLFLEIVPPTSPGRFRTYASEIPLPFLGVEVAILDPWMHARTPGNYCQLRSSLNGFGIHQTSPTCCRI